MSAFRKFRFRIEQSLVGGSGDVAYLNEGEDPTEGIVAQVLDDLGTDLEVTISDTTMFLAAWRDPEHWLTDWAEKLGIGMDDVPGAVADLIAAAEETE